jgi:hypothetical protein
MAVNFPTSLDDFTNPASGDQLNSPSHSQQHKNINDAVEALEAKVGVDSSAVTTSHDYKIAQLEGQMEYLFTNQNTSHSPVTVTDSSEIDFTLDGQEITASLKSGSIDETKLDTSVNASLDKADSALQDLVDDTTPQLGGQLDVNGQALGDGTLELVKFEETASAVNEITIKNNSTGNAPEIKATGDDTNIDLNLVPKGTGQLLVKGSPVSGGGTSLWTAIAGTRASNTTIKVSGDQTAIFKKGMIVRWKESGVDKVAYVSIPSTYSSPDTTITICGNTCASIDSGTFKYSSILDIEQFARQFAYAGTVGATGTDVMNAYYAPEPMLVLGAEIYVGTVASNSGNTVVDINKNGTTMFTTKPTIAYNALTVATPFAADSGSSLALNDRVSIDIDTVTSTTFPVDLYVSLKIFPSRFLTLN